MRAYYHDGQEGPSIAAHDSGRAVETNTLTELGLIAKPACDLAAVDAIADARGYRCRDEISVSKAGLGDAYEAKLKSFFEEHLHEDEEIRWMREGSGYFDVRDATDKEWIRVRLDAGDLLVLPPGIYHRFTLDEGNFARAMRLFKEEPKWTPYPRGQDTEINPYRKAYVEQHLGNGITA